MHLKVKQKTFITLNWSQVVAVSIEIAHTTAMNISCLCVFYKAQPIHFTLEHIR